MPKRHLTRLITIICFVILLASAFSTLAAGNSAASSDHGHPKRILIRNAALMLTMDPSFGSGPLGERKNADILIDGDTIAAIGEGLHGEGAEVIDASGKIVMPGFVDIHNHHIQSITRGCGTDEDVIDWLSTCIFPLVNVPLDWDEAYTAVRLSALDLIGTGVTTSQDWSSSLSLPFVEGSLSALEDSGIRFVFGYRTLDNNSDTIRKIKRERIDPNPLATLQLAAAPSPFLYPDLVEAVKLARELGVMVNVHLLESIRQQSENQMANLQQAGAFDVPLLVDHAIHLTDADLDVLASHHVKVAHNPLSNMRLASGVIRMQDMHARGIAVGLGLDGGTNDTSDMFNTMRTAIGLQRSKTLNPKVFPTVEDVLQMATIVGARILGKENEMGSLTPGKKADLIIITPHTVNFGPQIDWVSQLVFNGQPRNVESVFVAGRQLLRNGKYVGVNSDQVLADAEALATRVRHTLFGE